MDKNSPLSKFAEQFSTQFAMAPNMSILITGGKGTAQAKPKVTNISKCKVNDTSCVIDTAKCGLTISPDSIRATPDSTKRTAPHIINTDKCHTNTRCPRQI